MTWVISVIAKHCNLAVEHSQNKEINLKWWLGMRDITAPVSTEAWCLLLTEECEDWPSLWRESIPLIGDD